MFHEFAAKGGNVYLAKSPFVLHDLPGGSAGRLAHGEAGGRNSQRSKNVSLDTHRPARANQVLDRLGNHNMIGDWRDRSLSPHLARERLMAGSIQSGDDIVALRRFTGLTQASFARALGISVHTLRNWEQGRRRPEGPALALLRVVARHPRILRENLAESA